MGFLKQQKDSQPQQSKINSDESCRPKFSFQEGQGLLARALGPSDFRFY